MDSLNDTFLSSKTRAWFEQKEILPETWGLREEPKVKLLELNVGLLSIRSPGSVYDPRGVKRKEEQQKLQPSKTHKDYEGLVILDEVMFEKSNLNTREYIAAILHEFGHHVYPGAVDDNSLSTYDKYMLGDDHDYEVSADKFVIECGYTGELASALAKFSEGSVRFKNDSVKNRIEHLNQIVEKTN